MKDDPRALLGSKLRAEPGPAEPFVARIREGHGSEITAIVFYGSLLSEKTGRPTSFHDFYVIVDRPDVYFERYRDRVLSHVLVPSIYYRVFERPDGPPLRCKICVMTTEQLARETSARAADIHNLGRFSKRMAVVYARDSAAFDAVVDACLSAGRTLRPLALSLLPVRFTLDEFVLMLLKLSYLGEQRVAEDAKVAALMEAEKDHYRRFYGALLEEAGLLPDAAGQYTQPEPTSEMRARTQSFLERSRKRGKMRWPKYILTVDGWLDILIGKIERHHGIQIELTERERRWPLLFAWGKYFALKRRGIVK